MVGPVLVAMAAILSPHQLHVHHVEHMLHMAKESHSITLAVQHNDGDHDGDDGAVSPVYASVSHVQTTGGTLGCAGLEALWRSAGGSNSAAFTAAEIAMAESGGNQYATGQAGERGYWQINPVNGALSTYDPYGNARAAIILSGNGSNWDAWTTYTQGLYIGRCLWIGRLLSRLGPPLLLRLAG